MLFFLRHHNDIDHLTPVIHRWSLVPGNDAVVVMTDPGANLDDFRLRFLAARQNVWVEPMNRLVKETAATLGRSDQNCTVGELLDRLVPSDLPTAIAFDYVVNPQVRAFLKAAKARGMKSVTLPHGDDPYVNFMITIDDIDYSGLRISRMDTPFDVFVSPSRFIARREGESWKHKHRVLGSPRFNDEWLAQLERLIEPADLPGGPERLKLVLFPRNAKYAVFWDEFARLLRLILQFPGVELVVARHPRQFVTAESGKPQEKQIDFPDPESVKGHETSRLTYVDPDQFHSAQLIAWADAVLSLGTSVAYEAVCRGKPVFEIEYLHPNRTVIGSIFRNSDVRCRDQIFDWLVRLKRDPKSAAGFYKPEEMKRFREQCIDLGQPDVLGRYVALLTEMAEARDIAASRPAV